MFLADVLARRLGGSDDNGQTRGVRGGRVVAGDDPLRCGAGGAQVCPRRKVTDERGTPPPPPPRCGGNQGDDSLSPQVRCGHPTVCEVRGVVRQSAAEVLVNPPAGLQEVRTLWTEREKVRPRRRRHAGDSATYGRGRVQRLQIDSSATCSPRVRQRVVFFLLFFL